MPSGITIGTFTIHFYGIIIMLGAIAAAYLAQKTADQRGLDGTQTWDMLIWVLIAGIIGARLYHILTPMPDLEAKGINTLYYLTHPLDAIAIWNGGLGIPGAVAGGALAVWIYTRRKHISFWDWMDVLSPAVALGQAIGRWGNFLNQELYGAPTNLPWAIYIDPQHRLPAFANQAYYHPLFLYESLWNLGNMALLLWLNKRPASQLKKGDIFFIYLIIYAVGRFFLEFLRLDASQIAGVNANQALMLVVFISAGIALVWRHWPRHAAPASPIDRTESA
jgi:phosphatidylglycerol:prolipoprotein diacylglycerol transferase